MDIEKQFLIAIDPVTFAKEVLGFSPEPWQIEALRANERRILLNCYRQSGKSSTAAVLALYTAIMYPGTTTLIICPVLLQAREVYRKVVDLRRMIPGEHKLLEDTKLGFELENKSRVMCVTADERFGRGFTADLIIIDEAARIEHDEVYYSMRPSLLRSNGRMILASTPNGKRGFFYHEWVHGGDDWRRIKVTVDDCHRDFREVLDEDYEAMPTWWYRQEYYCEFIQSEGQVFNDDEVRQAVTSNVEALPRDINRWSDKLKTHKSSGPQRYILGLDLGKIVDHAALVVLEQTKNSSNSSVIYVEHFKLGTDYLTIVQRVREYMEIIERFGEVILVTDAGGIGQPVVEKFKERKVDPFEIVITGGAKAIEKNNKEWSVPKEELVGRLKIAFESGNLRIAESLHQLDLLVDELLNFEYEFSKHANILFNHATGSHDDLVIALTMAIWFVDKHKWEEYEFLSIDFGHLPYPGMGLPLR